MTRLFIWLPIPSPERHTADVVFRNNVVSSFNVLEAATMLGIKKVVWASSISALGYAFRHRQFNPRYLPIDEDHPLLSQDSYGLSKMVGGAAGGWLPAAQAGYVIDQPSFYLSHRR